MSVKAKVDIKKVEIEMDALLKGAVEICKDEIKKEAPRRTGKLASGVSAVIEGNIARVGYGEPFYALFVERGHAVKRSRRGKVLGRVAPNPFMRRAFHASARAVTNYLVSNIKKETKIW